MDVKVYIRGRCKACYPGDILQCSQEAGHEGAHRALARKNSIVHYGDRGFIVWTKAWEAPPVDPAFIARLDAARESNMKYRVLGLVA